MGTSSPSASLGERPVHSAFLVHCRRTSAKHVGLSYAVRHQLWPFKVLQVSVEFCCTLQVLSRTAKSTELLASIIPC